MKSSTFKKILQTWKDNEQKSIADMSIAKTGDCLSFAQFDAGVFSPGQEQHIKNCPYCSRMVAMFGKYQDEKVFSGDDEEEAVPEQESIWKKLMRKLNDFVNTLAIFITPIPKPIRVVIPALITAVIIIFTLRSPGERYAGLAQIEPLYYQPIEIRGEEFLSAADRLFQQGMIFYQQGNYQLAIKQLLQVIEKHSGDVNAHFYLGLCYLLIKNPDRAISHFNKVIELKGEFLLEKCYWYLGNAYLLKNDGKRALEMFEKVVVVEGDYEWEAREMIEKISTIK